MYDDEKLPHQPWHLGILIEADKNGEQLMELKGAISEILLRLGLSKFEIASKDYETKDNPALESFIHPYRKSTLLIGSKNIGVVGEISPMISEEIIGSENRLIFAELDLSTITTILSAIDRKQYSEISKFPASVRDVSFWIKDNTEIGKVYLKLLSEVKQIAGEDLEADISFLDEYSVDQGDGDKDKKRKHSVTFRLSIQPLTETVTNFKLNDLVNTLTSSVIKEFGIEVRE
jgi:phenylalanyl-tRNA synthetase beta subunit